jgi:hypothetical protein
LEHCSTLSVAQAIDILLLCRFKKWDGLGIDMGCLGNGKLMLDLTPKLLKRVNISKQNYQFLFEFMNYYLFNDDYFCTRICDTICDKLVESKIRITEDDIYLISQRQLFNSDFYTMALKLCKCIRAVDSSARISSRVLLMCTDSFNVIGKERPSQYDNVDIGAHIELLKLISDIDPKHLSDLIEVVTPYGYDIVTNNCREVT